MKKEKIKVVSLFSGIGGFEEGLRMAEIDADIVFASEIDSFAQKSYIANFGSDNLFGDITQIDEKDIPDHTLLMGGFPCQSFSIAGQQKGFADTRGTLFFDVARILNEKKPRYVLLENVKNLISHDNSNTILKILNTLSEIGYAVDFTIINSNEAGVPQNRDRTYICGILDVESEKFEIDKRCSQVSSLKSRLNETDFRSFNFFNSVKFYAEPQYIESILEDNVDSKFFFSKEPVVDFLMSSDSLSDVEKNENRIIKLFDFPRDVHNDMERQRRVYSVKGISPTVLARADSTKIFIETREGKKVRKVTPTENFYIQGFSKQFVQNIKNAGMSDGQMYKQSGNAVSPPVIAGILKTLVKNYKL